MCFDLKPYLEKKQTLVNQALTRIIDSFDRSRELIQAAEHSLMAGGKRLRPVLCLAAAQIGGSDSKPALPVSCAIEMIHTYSLIHDDLPAMDDDDLRRGVLTCHKKFSEATAILAGDALLTHAFFVLSRPEAYFDTFPEPGQRLTIIQKIASAAGISGMVEGQMLDMHPYTPDTHTDNDLDHLKTIHGLKTGKMISASVEAGALSVGTDSWSIAKLIRYADSIGLAFQVVDDILNIEGNPKIMGKASGSDALNEKMTFPALIGLERSKKFAKELIDKALEALSGFGAADAAPLKAIAQYIIDRDH